MDAQPRHRRNWPRVVAGFGIVLAIVLTAVIWLKVIDSQATAMPRGEEITVGTPVAIETPPAYRSAADNDELRPMP